MTLHGNPYHVPPDPDWEQRWRIVRIAAGTILLGVLSWQAIRLPGWIGGAATQRLDPALANLNSTLANLNASTLAGKKLIDMVSKDYYDADNPEAGWYWDTYAMMEASTTASRTSEEFLEDLRAALLGGKDTRGVLHQGTFPALNATLAEVQITIVAARHDLNRLTDSTDAALRPLAGVLSQIEALTADLDRQIKEASPKANQTFASLNKAVEDFDKLLADPNIARAVGRLPFLLHYWKS